MTNCSSPSRVMVQYVVSMDNVDSKPLTTIWFNSVLDPEPHFVADGFDLRRIHRKPFGGKRMKLSGGFGAQFISQHVLALFEEPNEKHDLLVPQFEVRAQAPRPTPTTPQFDRFTPGGFHILERQ